MDLFELNKIAGAILGTGLAIFFISEIGNVVVAEHELEESAYTVAVVVEEPEEAAEEAAAEEAPAAEEGPELALLLAEGDVEAGRKAARKCAACHSFDQGGSHKVGPNLWDIVGAEPGGKDGYSYSDAVAGLEGQWSYAELDGFLANPMEYAKGTKMTFTGIKDPEDRANVILFLRSLSDSPPPLP